MYFDNYFYGYLTPEITVVARPKFNGLVEHWGVRLPDGSVMQNTPERGVHIVSYEEFAAGKPVRVVRRVPDSEYIEVLGRIQQELANPRPYHITTNNCETLANRITGHEAKSSQARFWVAATGVALLAVAASRA